MPQKYKTRIGESGATLSRGQQQRIALAQALISLTDERKILVLDEFTSALDSETEERILRNIEPWLRGRTVVIVAHRLCTVRKLADQIIVLDRSGIVEQGTHAELIAAGRWYAEMARLQAVGAENGQVWSRSRRAEPDAGSDEELETACSMAPPDLTI